MSVSQLIELLILLILAGFFAGITIAFLHINRFSMEIKRKKGLRAGRTLAYFNEQPIRYVATGVIGYLACMVVFSILLNYILLPYWVQMPFNSLIIKILAQFLIAGILFLLFTVVPRSLFRTQANRLLPVFSFPISLFSKLFYPIASLMTGLSNWMLQYLFNIKITHEGIPYEMAESGTPVFNADRNGEDLKDLNTDFFENALNLPHIKVRNALVPRKEVEGLMLKSTIADLKHKFIETRFSKLIIYEDNLDKIVGYVHQLDLFGKPSEINEVLRPIMNIPTTMNVVNLLTQMIHERKNIARVIDEFGGTAGIITMEDLLEEIFGDIHDEYDANTEVEKQIAKNEYLFSGRLEIDYLSKKYNLTFGKTGSETLSGYIIEKHELIPKERERLFIEDFEFDIVSVLETRIEMVKMKILR